MSGDEESYEEHVLQNNTRLVSIAGNLREPQHFAAACTELTQWCSDPRAYTPHFEENLICVENGTKDGFDFGLAHQLITCCFQHRKLLSKESAEIVGSKRSFTVPMTSYPERYTLVYRLENPDLYTGDSKPIAMQKTYKIRINRWYEQYRRIKKNGGKRKRKTEMPPVDPGGLEQITVTDSGCTSMWPQGGPMAGPAPLTSPGYQQMIMPGYGNMPQPSPFPMDPTGARPGYPEGQFDQAAMMQHQQQRQRMMQMHLSQQQQRRGMMPGPQVYADPNMYPIPMGANTVPGQSQPLLRMPSQPGQPYPSMMPGRGPMMSPAYPQGNSHQMIKASPPVLFSNLQQQQLQSQPVMSYPNPHAMPPPYHPDTMVMVPDPTHLVTPFSPPDGMTHYHTTFTVPPNVYNRLSNDPSYNLQLKSYSSQDDSGTHRTQWPVRPGTADLAVQILINGNGVPIMKDRSSMVKNYVKQGENKLEIHCMTLPFKHYFSIQPISMVPISKFTEEIFTNQQKKGWTVDHFKQKLIGKGNGNAVSIPLLDGKSGKKLKIPARCHRCQHTNAFELYDVLIQQGECNQILCPIQGCNMTFTLNELEIDCFIGDILRYVNTNNSTSTEAVIEHNGCWRLVVPSAVDVSSRKRSADDANAHSLKRIKSEHFPHASSSPFPSVNSVPGGIQFGQSPANLMSPLNHNISPKKEIMSPPATTVTSLTPPVVKDDHQPLPGAATLTSPQGLPMMNNGSVDSTHGSAPYTPASMNGTVPAQAAVQQADSHNISLTTLENEILEPFRPDTFSINSPIEIQRYLQDGEITTRCHSYKLDDQTLDLIFEILNKDAIIMWGVDLKTLATQMPPLRIPDEIYEIAKRAKMMVQ